MAKLASHIYSEALFEVAVEMDRLEEINKELKFVSDIFQEHPMFFKIFVTPRICKEERKKTIEDVFASNVSEQVLNFLRILIDKRREMIIHDIYHTFSEMADERLGIVNAVVESAVELDDKEKERLREKINKMTGNTVRLECVVHPEILGGIIVKMGDKVIDGSVKSKLEGLKANLSELIV